MKKNILIANSSPSRIGILETISELDAKEYSFAFLLRENRDLIRARELGWKTRKMPAFVFPRSPGKLARPIAVFFSGLLLVPAALALKRKKISHVICFCLPSKIFFAAAYPVSKAKPVWIENLDNDYSSIGSFAKKALSYLAKSARVAAMEGFSQDSFSRTVRTAETFLLRPGIKSNHLQHQENIFEKIAEIEHGKRNKNFLTVGVVSDFKDSKEVEAVFKAVKLSLEVVPSVQIIVIGDGPGRKSLAWLAKKMEIENLVWFVGEQKQIKKWMDSFDIYIYPGNRGRFEDYRNAITAQICGLPVLVREGSGLDDCIVDGKSGFLLDSMSAEKLADRLIELLKDGELRQRMGENAKNFASVTFSMDEAVKGWKELLD